MNSAYLTQLKSKQSAAIRSATFDGIQIGLNIVAVALNREFNFGAERLTRLEAEVNHIIEKEFIDRHDPEQAAHDLKMAVEQIRGKK